MYYKADARTLESTWNGYRGKGEARHKKTTGTSIGSLVRKHRSGIARYRFREQDLYPIIANTFQSGVRRDVGGSEGRAGRLWIP